MAGLGDVQNQLNTLEQLAAGNSPVHRLHPLAKMLVTALFLFTVAGFDRYQVSALLPFLLYPAVVLGLAGVPFGLVLRRTLVALPFCLFGCLSNLIFDRAPAISYGGQALVTWGMVSTAAILLRALLCVCSVLVLAAVTPLSALTAQLRRMGCPGVLVSLLEMTYRYLGLLAQEAHSLYTAYILRSGGAKGVAMGHMGSLVGQLLLRSFDRAERIYHAMLCRGYASAHRQIANRPWTGGDSLFFFGWGIYFLLCRTVNIPLWLGGVLSCLL